MNRNLIMPKFKGETPNKRTVVVGSLIHDKLDNKTKILKEYTKEIAEVDESTIEISFDNGKNWYALEEAKYNVEKIPSVYAWSSGEKND